MSHHGLAIMVVGDVDVGCLTRLRAIQGAEVRCITALADAPVACGERHVDVILLGTQENSAHDAAVIAALRRQDAAANRYSCVGGKKEDGGEAGGGGGGGGGRGGE